MRRHDSRHAERGGPTRRGSGIARVVTDRATVGYLCDVIIAEAHRGKGAGQWLLQTILDHPDLRSNEMAERLSAALGKGLFVRKPSIDAEFATKKDVQRTDAKIAELRADVDEKFESLQIERQRNIGELHDKINGVAGDVAFIRGRMERGHREH